MLMKSGELLLYAFTLTSTVAVGLLTDSRLDQSPVHDSPHHVRRVEKHSGNLRPSIRGIESACLSFYTGTLSSLAQSMATLEFGSSLITAIASLLLGGIANTEAMPW